MPDDVADQYVIETWPDTQAAIHLFLDMSTQWRSGFSGRTGLDYAALPTVLDLRGIPAAEREGLFDDLRVMEIETLKLQAKEAK